MIVVDRDSPRMREYEKFVKSRLAEHEKFKAELREMRRLGFETICVHGAFNRRAAYDAKSIIPSTALSSSSPFMHPLEAAAVLSYDVPGFVYTRISNPTNYFLELQMAMLEGYKLKEDTEALFTSSGMSAIFMSVFPFIKSGDNIVSSNRVYGGTYMLFSERLKQMGFETRWIERPWDLDEWKRRMDGRTRLLFVESPTNPALFVADIKELADLAHSHEVPLIVDSTIATPVLMRPFEFGADIVVHSVSKALCGSGRIIGGCLVSRENIVTRSTEKGLKENFADWVRKYPYRDFGPAFSPANAERVIDEMKTLKMRMKKHSENAMKVAKYLEAHPRISKVHYPGLESFEFHKTAKKYMKVVDEGTNAYSYLLSFEVKGSIDDAEKVCENLRIGHLTTDLGKSSTIFIQPATTTHLQLGQEARGKAGITDGLIRYSAGLEDADDLIADLERALASIK